MRWRQVFIPRWYRASALNDQAVQFSMEHDRCADEDVHIRLKPTKGTRAYFAARQKGQEPEEAYWEELGRQEEADRARARDGIVSVVGHEEIVGKKTTTTTTTPDKKDGGGGDGGGGGGDDKGEPRNALSLLGEHASKAMADMVSYVKDSRPDATARDQLRPPASGPGSSSASSPLRLGAFSFSFPRPRLRPKGS